MFMMSWLWTIYHMRRGPENKTSASGAKSFRTKREHHHHHHHHPNWDHLYRPSNDLRKMKSRKRRLATRWLERGWVASSSHVDVTHFMTLTLVYEQYMWPHILLVILSCHSWFLFFGRDESGRGRKRKWWKESHGCWHQHGNDVGRVMMIMFYRGDDDHRHPNQQERINRAERKLATQ